MAVRARGWVLDRQPAPKPFDFQVMPGELWMLVGAVNSGRRELIYSLAGLIEPRAGRLELFGRDVASLGPRARAHLHCRIGVVLEQPGLVPAWSVFENLALLVRYHRLAPGGAVEDYVVKFVESCRLSRAILGRLVSDLSPLESQWIGLLRALVIRPRLLLVSAYLPQETLVAGYGVWTFFAEVVAPMNMAILVDVGPQALPIGAETRLLVMDEGTLLAAGRARELAQHPDPAVRSQVRFDHA
ncbi:MAG: ATP-binding cassette domain-containing protein [Candidatus Contendobacter sp.]|nr:ATP-binding cassette domain-containing protein [Candidatus Contendobacter sp.]MDG4556133.1 ATP-binding cassette domain-containing protein [Candidatus Contendobacter sp.]